jgi:hypothetical protein
VVLTHRQKTPGLTPQNLLLPLPLLLPPQGQVYQVHLGLLARLEQTDHLIQRPRHHLLPLLLLLLLWWGLC